MGFKVEKFSLDTLRDSLNLIASGVKKKELFDFALKSVNVYLDSYVRKECFFHL